MDAVPINKTMDRDDLMTADGGAFVHRLNALAETLEEQRLPIASWYGALTRPGLEPSVEGLKAFARRLAGGPRRVGPTAAINRGGDSYEPVPGITRDNHHPWFLYWEAYWVGRHGPQITPSASVLDAGGAASLFGYHLAAQGAETHSVSSSQQLVAAAATTARAMGWDLRPRRMSLTELRFDAAAFDHAYAVGVLAHLDAPARKRSLEELARVLKPGGILALTFDYGAPGLSLMGAARSYDPKDAIRSPEDVQRHFLSCERFEPLGNARFFDNGKTYLAWPPDPSARYTFGALFIRKLR